jgi:glycosyltransferase involved in cell wall biosynthesis
VRVLHLCPDPEARSGIAHYAERYRRAVRSEGVEIEALTPDSGAALADLRRFARRAVAAADGFDVVHAELGGAGLAEYHAAHAVARRPDMPPLVLTAHDPPRLIWRPLQTAAVRGRRPLEAATLLADPVARRADRALVRRAAAVLTLSALGAQRLRSLLAAPSVAVLPYPAPGDAPPAGPAPADRDLVLGFHGYWYGGKGLDALLQAVAALRADRAAAGVRLRLWGAPPVAATATADRRRLGILATIDRLGLTAAVDVLGPLAEDDVPGSLATCDAIVLPYVQPRTMRGLASISSAALDALAAGVPVVATDVRAMGETVRDGVDGLLVAPDDPEALTAALRRLRDDLDLRVTLRSGSRERTSALTSGTTGRAAADIYQASSRDR